KNRYFLVLSVDTDAPIVSGCPGSASYPVPCGTQSRSVTWIEPTAFDNSGRQPTISRSHQPGQNFPVGTTPVTYIFTDSSGNEAQCSFTITVNVVDTIPPVISGCPLSATYTVPLGTPRRIVSWLEPAATDDCGVMPTSLQSHSPGDSFVVGVTQVTYIFSDSSGNDEFCSFSITGNCYFCLVCQLLAQNREVWMLYFCSNFALFAK
ncbi:hyalin-like, partial [Amphiura filiformis]|uniref:hyalin-like n=1 Tax=Amphiura filiformis TaxID=82378 RepID=UPI003B211F43